MHVTHEEFTTFMSEICAFVNNRPHMDVSCSSDSPHLLTPSMLLTMKTSPNVKPFPPLSTKDALKSAWKNVQVMAEDIWRRLKIQFLLLPQKREKWHEHSRNIKNGGVVVDKDENSRNKWLIVVLRRTFESQDGRVRKVEIAFCNLHEEKCFVSNK